jgi:iron complex transport system substrate-binding protein
MRQVLILILCLLCLVGCQSHSAKHNALPDGNKYATGFQITPTEEGLQVEVFQPYTKMLIREPLQRIGTMSAVQIGFLDALNANDKVVAVCNPELVYTPLTGTEINIGDAIQPNAEHILQANLDLLLAVHYGQAKNVEVERLEKLGVPVLYINEWQENHPLARTEWIRVVGALIGQLHKADSIFLSIENQYLQLAQKAQEDSALAPPSIMTGGNFRGTWYVPGGESYLAQIFKDANADYPLYNNTQSTSIPLTIEEVLHSFHEADVWIGASAYSLDELASMDEKHTWFAAYKNKRVYNWYKQQTQSGANNFWERGVVYPNEILADLMAILNNDTTTHLHYASRLK